jgi:hypothetical protein
MDKVKKFILEVGYNIYKAWELGWYPFFIFILLLTTPTYGQVTERAQKQAKVIEQRTQSRPPQWNPQRPNNQNPRPQRIYTPYYYNPMVWTPYWNPHRSWDNRTYIITTDENRIQSQRNPLRVSIGVLSEITTQQPTIAPYLVLGGKTFLMTQYHWGGGNLYPHYNNIYQWEVDEWEDEFIKTQQQRREFVIGLGTTIKRFSPYIGMGFPTITQWDIYKDETYTLSSSQDLGRYSINERRNTKTNLKLGVLYGWDSFEALLQISSFEGLSFGDGLRIGLGIGIKL